MKVLISLISILIISLVSFVCIGNSQNEKMGIVKEKSHYAYKNSDMFENGLLPLPDGKEIAIEPLPLPKDPPPSPKPLSHSKKELKQKQPEQ